MWCVRQTQELPSMPASLPLHVKALLLRCLSRESSKRPSFEALLSHLGTGWKAPSPEGLPQTHASRESVGEGQAAGGGVGGGEGDSGRLQEQLRKSTDMTAMLRTQLELLLQGVKATQDVAERSTEGDQAAKKRLDVAKQMLRLESCRTRQLATHVERLSMVVWQVSQSLQLIIQQAHLGAGGEGSGRAGAHELNKSEGWRPSLARLQALADLVTSSAEGKAGESNDSSNDDASAANTPAFRSVEPLEWLAGPLSNSPV
ncbi:hypothetical protein T484DRAFT_3072706 [Baffinella frigidus]|nr:hypothetical protein T484DRAFT_3072706 [Cryptophyta sp. CCMP2293]